MGAERFGFVFRVKLTTKEPGMLFTRKLDNLYKLSIGRDAAKDQPGTFKALTKFRIKFVTMTMPLADFVAAINLAGQRILRKIAGPGAQTHGAAKLFHVDQI